MTNLEQLIAYHKDMCNNARELVKERGIQYSNEFDTLSTFKLVGSMVGVQPSSVAFTLLCVKVARLKTYMMRKDSATDDSIYDLINYAIYVSDLFKGENDQ